MQKNREAVKWVNRLRGSTFATVVLFELRFYAAVGEWMWD
jgi:hypothetical protein